MTAVLRAGSHESQFVEIEHLLGLSNVVGAIGAADFAEQILSFFSRATGADHCSLFQLTGSELVEIAFTGLDGVETMGSALTRYEVRRQLSMVGANAVRTDVVNIQGGEFRARRQCVIFSAQRADVACSLRIARSCHHAEMPTAKIDFFSQIADTLMSAVVKHIEIIRRPHPAPTLSSLTEIENRILTSSVLSRREAEVCARVLYGLSSICIATDLNIGKESVMTYRKRAYQRLEIRSQHDLFVWYLSLWSVSRPSQNLLQ